MISCRFDSGLVSFFCAYHLVRDWGLVTTMDAQAALRIRRDNCGQKKKTNLWAHDEELMMQRNRMCGLNTTLTLVFAEALLEP